MKKLGLFLSIIATLTLTFASPAVTFASNIPATGATTGNTQAGDTANGANGSTTGDTATPGSAPETAEPENPDWPVAPELTAGSAILIDADSGTILYQRDCHMKAYPASVTKLMTALLTVENCSLSETVTFSHDAAHSITWEDSQIPVVEGEQYTVEQALYALLLKSANEVAYGLGEHVAGDINTFAQMMTARAAELGALGTNFANASGLSHPEHYTTAYDIAMFSRACMNNPTIMEIMTTRQYVIPPSNKYGYERTINQSHKMLVSGEFYYEYARGGKTGFTDESLYTLCTFATKGEMNLIAVVLRCPEPTDRFSDTIKLFEYGFNNFEKLTLTSADTSSLLGSSDYYNSKVFGGSNVSFSLASSAVTVPMGTSVDDIEMVINRNGADADTFANVEFRFKDMVVGNSELVVSTTSGGATTDNSLRPTNLPFLPAVEAAPPPQRDYIVINAVHILYGVIIFSFLAVILLGLLFMNYSEYGKELMKTRKRRRGYRRRKLRF